MHQTAFDFPEPPPRGVPRYRGHGLVASTLLHIAVFGGLLVTAARPWYFDSWAAREARILYVTVADEIDPPPTEAEPRVVTDPSDVTEVMLQEKIDQLTEQSQQRSDQENLARLDQLAERLDEVSSQQSVDRMAGVFQALLGTKPRADRPAEKPVAGEFDFDTAQFHDVRREETGEGIWRYLCVLVDAEGRAIEVEMDATDGETVYQTMLRIKQNPLLERVYRQIAMPLFDKMLSGARQAARTAAKPIDVPTQPSDSEQTREPIEEP